MSTEPEWLQQARARGLEIREQGVNVNALAGVSATAGSAASVSMTLSEADFQAHVIDLAHQCGWKVAHCRKVLVKMGERTHYETPLVEDGAGFPDLILAKPAVGVVFAELKSEAGQLRAEQKQWGLLLLAAGSRWFCWRPSDWPRIVEVLAEGGPLRPSAAEASKVA